MKMKFNYGITFIISSLLSLSACSHSNKDNGNIPSDTIVVIEPEIIPLSEISIKGKWESKDNPLYPVLEFKGKSSVLIGTILGPIATSYERDEEFIRIKADNSDLLLELVSEDSIVGSGWANGLWVKQK
ncbi:MAG: hypothetical protein K2M25_06165 [Muribaculaceae bacterium]|nr:hypothetical protein [Muribaculaceae bacterium]